MKQQWGNGLVAGAIAGVIALLCWRFLADASWGTAAGIAVAFFVGTMIIAMLLGRYIRGQAEAKRRT